MTPYSERLYQTLTAFWVAYRSKTVEDLMNDPSAKDFFIAIANITHSSAYMEGEGKGTFKGLEAFIKKQEDSR